MAADPPERRVATTRPACPIAHRHRATTARTTHPGSRCSPSRRNDTEVLVARGLRIAITDNGIDEESLLVSPTISRPDPDDCERWSRESGRPQGQSFSDAMDVRLITGRPFDELGPAHVWLRLTTPILVGEEIHPLDRAIVAGDYANGMSNVVPFTTHRYVNSDLTVALHRYPAGEWISLDASTHARRDGHGTAHGFLSDRTQPVGHTIQSLVIDSR
ncbi:MAG: thioesterase family protein [Acidimicrobiia bacterium]|nr:thioesterase family protein [Acidimicrobiia bacterium]